MASTLGFEGALRKVLVTDSLTCAACGALMSLGATQLATIIAIPRELLFYAGLSLFPVAALMAFVAARGLRSVLLVWLVIVGNAAWTLASLWLLLESNIQPNVYGKVFVGFQAAVVAALTALELRYAPASDLRVASAREI